MEQPHRRSRKRAVHPLFEGARFNRGNRGIISGPWEPGWDAYNTPAYLYVSPDFRGGISYDDIKNLEPQKRNTLAMQWFVANHIPVSEPGVYRTNSPSDQFTKVAEKLGGEFGAQLFGPEWLGN
jgi:hypothetical protein